MSVGVKSGEEEYAAMPESMQLLLGRIHKQECSVSLLSLLSAMMLISLLSHRIFRRAEGCAERRGELSLKRLLSNVNIAPSAALTAPMELLINEHLIKEESACVMCMSEPRHAHDGYFASSGAERAPYVLLNFPANEHPLALHCTGPESETNFPCAASAEEDALVRLASVQLLSVSVTAEVSLVSDRSTGADTLQWMFVHVTDENESEIFWSADEGRLGDVDVNAEEDVSVMSSTITCVSVTAESAIFITDKQISEFTVQLFSVSVPELTVITVQFSRISVSLLEVIVHVFSSRELPDETPMNEGMVEEKDSLKEIFTREKTALPSTPIS